MGLIYRILKDDFVCLVLTLTLLFSGLRSKQALDLIRKNFKRNLTIGFLLYDYKKDLIAQNILLLKDIQAVMQSILILLYVVRVKATIQRCR